MLWLCEPVPAQKALDYFHLFDGWFCRGFRPVGARNISAPGTFLTLTPAGTFSA
jgi:hypothetical protein